jgi:EAL domain-containing protein (putative c-di-GMP-specific phosphodiesterase class I)
MYLEKMDCERVQGYYFSRPVPEEQIIDMLEEQTSKLHK